jgi:energy-coupling factor transporter ATP-binding protein EcfA2
MTIILRHFNKNRINNNNLLVIIGANSSGKTTLTKDILNIHKDIPSGIVICNNKEKYNYIPPIFIHNKYDRSIIKQYIKRQNLLTENEYDNRSFIILDDCLYSNSYYKDKYFLMLLESSNIYNYLCIINTQYFTKLNEKILNNIYYVFILKDDIEINRQRLYEQFKNKLNIQYSVFVKLLNDYTSNYNLLVLDIKCNSMVIEDKLYWYKADIHNKLILCNEESWNYNNSNYIIEPPKRSINRSIFY